MSKPKDCLTVCICLTSPEPVDIPLTQIAGGHVFGPHQRLKLVLQGVDDGNMMDMVSDVQDCCFPLLEDISTTPCPDYDVVAVFLPREKPTFSHPDNSVFEKTELDSMSLKYLVRLALFIGDMIANSVNDKTQLLVLGNDANLMASLLSEHLEGICGNKLLTFQPEVICQQMGRDHGQYTTANTLCQTVSAWWAGTKMFPSNIKAGVKFFGKTNTKTNLHTGLFFSVPVEVKGEATFRVCPGLNLDQETVSMTFQKTSEAFKEMSVLTNGEYDHNYKKNSSIQMSCL